jgi:SAM-dependent methyltransferase
MGTRACPCCDARDARPFGRRLDATFLCCRRCRSIFRDLSLAEFESLHATAFEDSEFSSRIELFQGKEPDRSTWAEVLAALGVARRVLEIGPGTGHLLAAARDAGCEVFGVETSGFHRELMRRLWGIETVAGFDEVPSGRLFDAVVAINVYEHVYDVVGFLRSIAALLAPGGRVFVSTCNAGAFVARLSGTRWAMFKQVDHVSFPSGEGMRTSAERAGLRATRIWTHELPFETPIGILVAARDSWRESRTRADEPTPPPVVASGARDERHDHGLARRWLRLIYRLRAIDPTAPLLSWLHGAATVKSVLEHPSE